MFYVCKIDQLPFCENFHKFADLIKSRYKNPRLAKPSLKAEEAIREANIYALESGWVQFINSLLSIYSTVEEVKCCDWKRFIDFSHIPVAIHAEIAFRPEAPFDCYWCWSELDKFQLRGWLLRCDANEIAGNGAF